MRARRALLSSLVCALVCVSACRPAAESFPPAQRASTSLPGEDIFNLQLTKAQLRADGASEALIDKIGASAFRYFRAMAEPSKHRTCEAFRDLRWRLPSGAVHGDAHLEQFVVTDDDFGLADFDNAGYGPAIVDVVRYASSLISPAGKSKEGAIRNKPSPRTSTRIARPSITPSSGINRRL
jgi:Ser/Thr protein kinase RdoA (MazF antagonist)